MQFVNTHFDSPNKNVKDPKLWDRVLQRDFPGSVMMHGAPNRSALWSRLSRATRQREAKVQPHRRDWSIPQRNVTAVHIVPQTSTSGRLVAVTNSSTISLLRLGQNETTVQEHWCLPQSMPPVPSICHLHQSVWTTCPTAFLQIDLEKGTAISTVRASSSAMSINVCSSCYS